MAVAVGFSLQQFSEVLKIRDEAGQPYVLIDGQAVNYWAERYASAEPQLETLRPFTSQDIDFKGNRADVQRIARQLELNPSYPSKVEMTALSGFILFQIGSLKSAIEVVRRIPGISENATSPNHSGARSHFAAGLQTGIGGHGVARKATGREPP